MGNSKGIKEISGDTLKKHLSILVKTIKILIIRKKVTIYAKTYKIYRKYIGYLHFWL